MQTQKIYSKNAIYQKFEVLKTNRNKRYKYYSFFVEGVRNINGAVQNGWQIESFLYSLERPLSHWAENLLETVPTETNYQLTSSLMADLSSKEETSELLAVVKMRQDDTRRLVLSQNPILALFDRPSNKGNLGTMIRSCDALGVEALLLTGHTVDLYDPDVIASSMGSFFKVPALRLSGQEEVQAFLQEMREKYPNLQTVGTTAHKQTKLYELDLRTPVIFFIGNETDGLCRSLKESSDVLATIPMNSQSSASSFNVGCAATVLFYEAVRQREQ